MSEAAGCCSRREGSSLKREVMMVKIFVARADEPPHFVRVFLAIRVPNSWHQKVIEHGFH